MLPDWDFGGDEAKRRAFIQWVWSELERFDALLTPTPSRDDRDWISILTPGLRRSSAGRPGSPLDDTNGLVWDYLLLRYMFARYWPGKRRREDDPASAINMAVSRSLALPPGSRKGGLTRQTLQHEARERLIRELKRGIHSVFTGRGKPRAKSLGRQQAEADIATLENLPANLFAK